MRGNEVLDFAIVGGGVSGLYTAWRLSGSDSLSGSSFAIFEASDRTGGRLWSVGLEQDWTIPAELGGMFFSDTQPFVYGLCTKALNLDIEALSPKPDFAYVRRTRFRISDLDDTKDLPYNLADDEKGLPYAQLMVQALLRIAPELKTHWPMAEGQSEAETIFFLRQLEIEGRPLHEWGFWNLLSRSMSNEAYICVRDLVSSYSFFANWNAYDAILSLLNEFTGDWFKLPRGYEFLTQSLKNDLDNRGIDIHKGHTVSQISNSSDSSDDYLEITIETDDGQKKVYSRQVILALPKAGFTNIFGKSQLPETDRILDELSAVESVPACKIFLSFREPWWRTVPDGPGKIDSGTFAVSHTDLPMRQCYYLGVDPKTGEGLLLASFGDAQSVPFWSTLVSKTGRSGKLLSDLPKLAIDEICRQLGEMHGIDIPEPRDAIFVDWSCLPYGGAWHAWRPGWKSWEVMSRLRQPIKTLPLYLCGESLCAHQGWVEGALASSEVLLQEHFGLKRPDWLSSDDALTAYRI